MLIYLLYILSTYKRVVKIIYLEYISASTIKFSPTNATFVPGLLYEELELTCSVEDSDDTQSSKSKDIHHVMSIVISRVSQPGHIVASISKLNPPARAGDGEDNVQVVGDVSGTTGNTR